MKIEQQELEQLKQIQNKNEKIIIDLGEISYNEILLKNKKQQIESILSELQDEERVLKSYLIQKYGDNLNIDIKTGEY